MDAWVFNEEQLGAALEAWARTRRPNADTAVALKAVAEFLNSEAAGKLRVRQVAEESCNATR